MAKKLTKGKRRFLLEAIERIPEDPASLKRRLAPLAEYLRREGFLDRQNRAYMAIYC